MAAYFMVCFERKLARTPRSRTSRPGGSPNCAASPAECRLVLFDIMRNDGFGARINDVIVSPAQHMICWSGNLTPHNLAIRRHRLRQRSMLPLKFPEFQRGTESSSFGSFGGLLNRFIRAGELRCSALQRIFEVGQKNSLGI